MDNPLALSLSYWWIAVKLGAHIVHMGTPGTLPIIIIGIVCIGMMFKAADLAQNLGGIVSTSSGAAMVGGMFGGAIGSTMSGLSIGKKGVGAAGGALGAAGGVFGRAGGSLGGGLAAAGSQAAQGAMSGLKAVAGDTKNWLKHTLRKGDFE